ncbi:MAG: Dephospho-CoA kinase [Candidatus Anoxychlamydiales bacterium]|nr:Dephospho-CoA kinase [Candidatus Anoxychlamydiales bacterium]NGX36657.1 Dephospho-CoA kinase [Candidatus Anoxychlamydiales bacterium]
MLKKIAITGNIASGKSQALKIFNKLGAYTIDADSIVHKLLLNDIDLKTKIVSLFDTTILEDEKIARDKIAKIVFKDETKLKKLENLLHPKVLAEIEKEYEKVKNSNFIFFIVEMPLLFEIGVQKLFDIVITISTKEDIAKKRSKDKDYMLRKKRQMPLKEKEKLSDFVIENNQDISSLEKNIKKISQIIKNL